MKTTKNIEKFNNIFQSYYDYLYEYGEKEAELNLNGLGDAYLKKFSFLAGQLAEFRHDPITSDRESAAFALAILHSYHISPVQIKIEKYQLLTTNPQNNK